MTAPAAPRGRLALSGGSAQQDVNGKGLETLALAPIRRRSADEF